MVLPMFADIQAACEEGEGSDTGNFEVLCMH